MHHVCLVSDQPIPNFLPMLNNELKPSKVTLVVTDEMLKKGKVEALKNEIAKRSIPIGDDVVLCDANDIPSISDALMNWLAENNDDDVVLNVTGGTKPMAIAAQEVFSAGEKPVFYVDIRNDKVLWIKGKGKEPIQLKDTSLKLRTLLSLNGIRLTGGDFKSSVTREDWKRFAGELASGQKYSKVLGILNRWASVAEERRKLSVTFDSPVNDSDMHDWNELIMELKGNNLIRSGNERQIEFFNEDARRFCNGAWIEHYVFDEIKKLGFLKDFAMMNATVEYGDKVKNELDCVVVTKNQLVIIECKTKNMERGDVANDAVYKLADLSQHLGGLRVKSILVSYRPLREVDKRRAKLLMVDVIENLAILDKELRRLLCF